MVDALVGLLDAAEEALDGVGVCAVLLLVAMAVVHAMQGDEADQVVIGPMLVGDQDRTRSDMFLNGSPGIFPFSSRITRVTVLFGACLFASRSAKTHMRLPFWFSFLRPSLRSSFLLAGRSTRRHTLPSTGRDR